MNNKELKSLARAAKEHKNICVPIETWIDLMKLTAKLDILDIVDEEALSILKEFSPINEKKLLFQGLYFRMFGSNFYCRKSVMPGNIRILDSDIFINNKNAEGVLEENWSEEIVLMNYGE
jgi:hypothetical protein